MVLSVRVYQPSHACYSSTPSTVTKKVLFILCLVMCNFNVAFDVSCNVCFDASFNVSFDVSFNVSFNVSCNVCLEVSLNLSLIVFSIFCCII